MKKSIILSLIILFIFAFGCTFNLFEGSVETNYKSIKNPSEKIEYARQILAAGDPEKIATIIALLKADLDAGNVFTDLELEAAANQIVGNLIIAESGFNDLIANAISEVASSDPDSGEEPDIVSALLDVDGNGEVDDTDLAALADIMQDLADAATYINDAAVADPENLDLQFQNVIANAAAIVVCLEDPENVQALNDYFDGTSTTLPNGLDNVQTNLDNIAASVDNMVANAPEGTFYYSIAQMLSEMFAGL